MQLTLFVPGLLLPREILSDSVFDLEAPMLSLLLGRGQRHQLDTAWLPDAFGLAAPLPAAAAPRSGCVLLLLQAPCAAPALAAAASPSGPAWQVGGS